MQLIEQLRWKRAAAQDRLLSRKRKLAQLYSVTAAEDPQHHAHADQLYKQQLQAFQDANDLLTGRRFDESTLPPRISVQVLKPKTSPNRSLRSSTPSKVLRRSKSPANVDSTLSPKPAPTTIDFPTAKQPPPLRPTQPPLLFDARDGESVRHGSPDHSNGDSEGTGAASAVVAEAAADAIPSIDIPDTHELGDTPLVSSKTTSKGSAQTSAMSMPKNDLTVPHPSKSDRAHSPLRLAPTTPAAEIQSSPASTHGASSSHTTGPTMVSPTTSPGNEEPLSASRLFPDEKSPHDQSAHVTPVQSPTLKNVEDDTVDNMEGVSINQAQQPSLPPVITPPEQTPVQGTDSRKQLSKINTQTTNDSYFTFHSNGGVVESPATITAATPRRTPGPTLSIPDSARRATRISSGALQKKSVSEILGETPKTAHPQHESAPVSGIREHLHSTLDQGAERDKKGRQRSQLSTVVFAKPQKSTTETTEVVRQDLAEAEKTSPHSRDYLYPLFENKAFGMTRQGTLMHLIQNAHKTLSTEDQLVDYEYQTQCRLLKRIYQLQNNNRWPLRQHKRAEEAPRPTSHWDFLLSHMKWMRTDFREERKWKFAAARELAEWCSEWVNSSLEDRRKLQIRVRPPQVRHVDEIADDISMTHGPGPEISLSSHPTPELLPSTEDDSNSDDIADPRDLSLGLAPAAIFSLGSNDFNFAIDKTPAFEKLLNELPLYEPARIEPDLSKSNLAEKRDAEWRTDIVPVSKYATEKIKVKTYKPPMKRSRYEYELEPADQRSTTPLPPQNTNVALFMPENKHIRDRIHPGHAFRPPAEHPMPAQAFFENRTSSQWTHAEDDELRRLVKEYSYNWSLISSCMSPQTLYASAWDRRTPWECFERWIGLEGLPADMSKTPYFKTYASRIEAAARLVTAQADAAAQRAGNNAPLPQRKRTTAPVRVERKRNQRHLAMLDAMRKLAKRRETTLQKQQHQADLAAMRKVNEANQPKPPISTPAEFSRLKHDREQKLFERQEIYRQQLLAHQRATAQQQRNPNAHTNNMPNAVGAPGVAIRPPTGVPGMPNGNLGVPNGHPRPHPAIPGLPNGMPVPVNMGGPKGLAQAQAQMQANMRGGMAPSPQQLRILNEAQRVQQEQLLRQQQQQQQASAQNGNQSSPNNPHASLTNANMNNPNFIAAMAAANGVPSPSAMNGNSSSPRSQTATMGGQLSSGHVPALIQLANNIRERNPNMSEDEVQRSATLQLTHWQQQATAAASGQKMQHRLPPGGNQAAYNAAMGAINARAHVANAAGGYGQIGQLMANQQAAAIYNQQLRMQQQAQQQAQGLQGMPQMGGSMTNSPMMTMARPTSQHTNQGQMSRSATPREQRSGSQSGMVANGINGAPQQGSPRGSQPSMQT